MQSMKMAIAAQQSAEAASSLRETNDRQGLFVHTRAGAFERLTLVSCRAVASRTDCRTVFEP
jgi:hypothetical protein